MDVWTPVQDEILRLIHECTNSVDNNAAVVMKEGQIVDHVPFNLALKSVRVHFAAGSKALRGTRSNAS